MKLQDCNIMLTGAAGGIGRHLALALADKGAQLALVECDAPRLEALCAEIAQRGGKSIPILTDLGAGHAVDEAVSLSIKALGRVDVLINNAGVMDFMRFEQQNPVRIEHVIHTNISVPLLLARAVLPHFIAQGNGHIVNIGSVLGSIGMAYYATYCASKFALRGFSEALRRELNDTPVGVTYVAPRATRTPLNDDRATRMLKATGATLDQPEDVARQIVHALELERKEVFIGRPETIFTRINGLMPGLIDLGMRKQDRIARQFTSPNI